MMMIRRRQRSLLSLILLLTTTRIAAEALKNVDDDVLYEESADTYVEYPQDSISQSLLESQPPLNGELLPRVTLSVWTTANDFAANYLYKLVKGIVRRLDKELIQLQPSYYLVDGVAVGCRLIDPTTSQETENVHNPSCAHNCTNHGRYCASSSTSVALNSGGGGAAIVEESLRRLCVWDVYGKGGGNNMLHFFRYVSDPLLEDCKDENCTSTVMERQGISTHFIDRCMNHEHGLHNDTKNPYLTQQLQRGQQLTVAMLPILKIDNYWYTGEMSTKEIFRTICAAYPANQQPIACQFCKSCQDVRYCLWFLQCDDGTTFDMWATAHQNNHYIPDGASDGHTLGQQQQQSAAASAAYSSSTTTSAPTTITTTISNSTQSSDTNPATTQAPSHHHKTSQSHHEQAKESTIHGTIVGLLLGLVVTSYYACRDYQAKLVLQEIYKEEELQQHVATKELGLDGTFLSPDNSHQNEEDMEESDHSLSTDDVFDIHRSVSC